MTLPLNEVELVCDASMANNGVLRGNNVVKYIPDQSVVKLAIGDEICLTAEEFEHLSHSTITPSQRVVIVLEALRRRGGGLR